MGTNNHNHTRRLRWLVAQRGSRCEFCGADVVIVADVPPSQRIKLAASHLVYHDGQAVVQHRVATVEHVTRRADGGGHEARNLRVACAGCNQARNRQHQSRRRRCKHCRRPFEAGGGRHRRSRSCRQCWQQHHPRKETPVE